MIYGQALMIPVFHEQEKNKSFQSREEEQGSHELKEAEMSDKFPFLFSNGRIFKKILDREKQYVYNN